MSSVHGTEVDGGRAFGVSRRMSSATHEVSRRLQLFRRRLGISQAELCRAIECRTNRWSQYESGERRITLEVAETLCDVYGLTLDWIYRGDPSGLPHRYIALTRPGAITATPR